MDYYQNSRLLQETSTLILKNELVFNSPVMGNSSTMSQSQAYNNTYNNQSSRSIFNSMDSKQNESVLPQFDPVHKYSSPANFLSLDASQLSTTNSTGLGHTQRSNEIPFYMRQSEGMFDHPPQEGQVIKSSSTNSVFQSLLDQPNEDDLLRGSKFFHNYVDSIQGIGKPRAKQVMKNELKYMPKPITEEEAKKKKPQQPAQRPIIKPYERKQQKQFKKLDLQDAPNIEVKPGQKAVRFNQEVEIIPKHTEIYEPSIFTKEITYTQNPLRSSEPKDVYQLKEFVSQNMNDWENNDQRALVENYYDVFQQLTGSFGQTALGIDKPENDIHDMVEEKRFLAKHGLLNERNLEENAFDDDFKVSQVSNDQYQKERQINMNRLQSMHFFNQLDDYRPLKLLHNVQQNYNQVARDRHVINNQFDKDKYRKKDITQEIHKEEEQYRRKNEIFDSVFDQEMSRRVIKEKMKGFEEEKQQKGEKQQTEKELEEEKRKRGNDIEFDENDQLNFQLVQDYTAQAYNLKEHEEAIDRFKIDEANKQKILDAEKETENVIFSRVYQGGRIMDQNQYFTRLAENTNFDHTNFDMRHWTYNYHINDEKYRNFDGHSDLRGIWGPYRDMTEVFDQEQHRIQISDKEKEDLQRFLYHPSQLAKQKETMNRYIKAPQRPHKIFADGFSSVQNLDNPPQFNFMENYKKR